MAPASSRRISYVVPPPTAPVPTTLCLPPEGAPRNGQTGPILTHAETSKSETILNGLLGKKSRYPRHRLAVAAFALDTATQLVGRDSPEGILYSGGRDGMIMAWDLNMPMRPRETRFGASSQDGGGFHRMGRWERLTIDEDDDTAIYEEEDDELPTSDGDVIGDVLGSSGRRGSRYWTNQKDVPFEQRWEIDVNNFEPGQPAYWRKHVQAHTDWVNDMLLCNLNQTVVSGSSDGTVKAWNPHSSVSSPPSTVGTHSDYVRCLTQCQERKWIASGSFDRTIKLWDTKQPRADPLVTLTSPDSSGPKASVYALATDPFGHVVAAGGPERVIRTWDPRSGKRTGKLVGHTDNIRAILMSEDSRYLLTGSADASIKLWSLLSPQRCIYTFTHHTESVWSLFSSHPGLEVFYSGDRSGIVCRVDVEDCQRISQGECISLCKDTGEPNMASSEGVSKIVAMDDHLVWTASGSSSIRRWRVPQSRFARAMTSTSSTGPSDEHLNNSGPRSLRRHASASSSVWISSSPPEGLSYRRLRGESRTPSISTSFTSHDSLDVETTEDREGQVVLNGIPYDSLIKLSVPNAHHGAFSFAVRGRDMAEVSTIYSAAPAKSAPKRPRSPSAGTFPVHTSTYGGYSQTTPTNIPAGSGPFPFSHSNPRMAYEDRDVAPDATPLASEPDLVIEGEHGFVRVSIMNDRMHALTVDTAGEVAVWDIVRCSCLGVFSKDEVESACGSANADSSSNSVSNTHSKASANPNTGGVDVGESDEKKLSPRQALEIVRDRIEGEAVVNPWANADTRIGELAIHISDRCFESEVFADEVGYGDRQYPDDHRLNIGKWVFRNLFMGFIKEEQQLASKAAHEKSAPSSYKGTHTHNRGHIRSSSESAAARERAPAPLNTSDLPPVPALPSDLSRSGSGKGKGKAAEASTSPRSQGHGHVPLSPIAQSPVGSVASDTLPTPRPGNYHTTTRSRSNTGNTAPASASDGPHSSATSTAANPAPTLSTSPTATAAAAAPATATTTPPATTSSASHDYFSTRRRPSTAQSATTATGGTWTGEDDFSGWGGSGSSKHDTVLSTPSTPGGGLMGRLKSFGKSTRRTATDLEMPQSSAATAQQQQAQERTETKSEERPPSPAVPKTLIEKLRAQGITPPSSHDGPTLQLPSDTAVIISEDVASGYSPIYRGTVGSLGADTRTLEELLPEWLLEFLMTNKMPTISVVKVSFVLLPWVVPPELRDVHGETLPELLNTAQSKLSASRFLRVRKLCNHVQDKLDKNTASRTSSPRSSSDALSLGRVSLSMTPTSDNQREAQNQSSPGPPSSTSNSTSRASTPRLSPNIQLSGLTSLTSLSPLAPAPLPRADEVYEILCNDQVLTNEMTLAAVRQFVWRQSAELVMHYRRKVKRPSSVIGGTPRTSTEQSLTSLAGSCYGRET